MAAAADGDICRTQVEVRLSRLGVRDPPAAFRFPLSLRPLKVADIIMASLLHQYRAKKVLITGGLGFIGSNLARQLVDLGAQVTVLDAMIPMYGGNRRNLSGYGSRLAIRLVDMRNHRRIAKEIKGQEILFNLAGQTSHMDSMSDPQTDLDINCGSQLELLESCRKHNPKIRIVFASTRQIYGKPEYLPVDENHPLRPVDVNGINKLAGEQYHLLYHKVHGIQSTALRLTNTIGPRMRIKDARQTFLGVWIKAAVLGESIDVWGGSQLRDFTYVDDAVSAFLLAGIHPKAVGKAFNVGGTAPRSLKEIAQELIAIAGQGKVALRPFPASRKAIDIGDYYADSRQLQQALGWSARTTLHEALSRTFQYYRREIKYYL